MKDQKVYKQFETKATSIDEANFNISFKVSDSRVDRDGEVVSQKDWLMDNYMANPVMLWGHDPKKPEYVIGTCLSMEYDAKEDCHYGTFHLDADFNDTAKLVWNQLVAGTLRTVSLGFINHDYDRVDGVPILKDVEPVETSVVPIPANPGALAKELKAGRLSKKDAKYLIKTMREEADRIDAQLEVKDPKKEKKAMDDETTKKLDSIVETVGKLAEGQAATNKRLDDVSKMVKQKGAVADILNADSGWEVNDEKWVRQQVVADMFYAFQEAYFYTATPASDFETLLQELVQLLGQVADGSYDPDAEGAVVVKALKSLDKNQVKEAVKDFIAKHAPAGSTDTKTKTADADEDDAKDDPAKGGQQDQPGAGLPDDINDDDELSEDQIAELDEEFAEAA